MLVGSYGIQVGTGAEQLAGPQHRIWGLVS